MADLELDGPNSAISVDTLKPKTATTLTLGESGDTIALGSGATSTGFGATYNGAVNWESAIKTADFTAVSGEGYFVDTTSGAITVTLPASPSAGAIVAIKDYAGTFASNNLTIARNSSNIQGAANDSLIETNRASVVLVFADSTKGWLYTNESNVGDNQILPFVAATGGTITTSGDFKIHTFTSSGTFTVTDAGGPGGSNTVDYLVIAGGGGSGSEVGGAGGAGGYRESFPNPATGGLSVSAQGYPITVGAGGAGNSAPGGGPGTQGSSSVFSTITSAGGGLGGGKFGQGGGAGGSGGGGAYFAPGGSGNTPSVSPPQGNDGAGAPNVSGGGGGGASSAGTAGPGGNGGNGSASTITGSSVTRAGGGGGSGSPADGTTAGAGGPGGGGAGSDSGAGTAGTANTGGGAGGGLTPPAGAAGGSGVVVIRYKFQ
jgi:hypothetical protein